MITCQDFEMWAGDTKALTVAVVDSNGDPILQADLELYTILWVLSTAVDAAPTISKSNGVGGGITVTGDGEFTIALVPANTAALSGTYYHEASVEDAGGQISTVLIGKCQINKSGITE